MRFDVYEVACASAPPHFKPSRAGAALADAALWQTAEFVATRVAARSAKEVWAELRRFTGLDEIWGPGTEPWPNDSLLFAVDDSRALRVYAVEEACCRFCGRPHRNVPGDLCPAAREQYDRVERCGEDLGLTTSDPHMTGARRSKDWGSTARASRRSWSRVVEAMADPTVVEVLRVEEPASGEGRRCVVVRWSDGSTGRALSYFADEILVSEGDMIGKTAAELRALHFARDREYLQRDD